MYKFFLFALTASCAFATTLSFQGDLRTDATFTSCGSGCTLGSGDNDDAYIQFAAVERDFVVPATSSMTAITFSYGGGTNGVGTLISEGGFEPYLSLFDPSGNFIASTLFGTTCPAGANANSSTGNCFDVSLDGGTLSPGTYAITISAFENMSFAENMGSGTLADGFTGLGVPGDGNLNYAFDVILNDDTAVPEPGSLPIVTILLLCLAGLASKAAKARCRVRARQV